MRKFELQSKQKTENYKVRLIQALWNWKEFNTLDFSIVDYHNLEKLITLEDSEAYDVEERSLHRVFTSYPSFRKLTTKYSLSDVMLSKFYQYLSEIDI